MFDFPVLLNNFIDLKKSFDRVRLHDVMDILRDLASTKLIRVVEDANMNTVTRGQAGQIDLSNEIKCFTGIRQADSLSPSLSSLVMHKIIDSVGKMTGYSEDNLQRLTFKRW